MQFFSNRLFLLKVLDHRYTPGTIQRLLVSASYDCHQLRHRLAEQGSSNLRLLLGNQCFSRHQVLLKFARKELEVVHKRCFRLSVVAILGQEILILNNLHLKSRGVALQFRNFFLLLGSQLLEHGLKILKAIFQIDYLDRLA
jgi:hypothetical protein